MPRLGRHIVKARHNQHPGGSPLRLGVALSQYTKAIAIGMLLLYKANQVGV